MKQLRNAALSFVLLCVALRIAVDLLLGILPVLIGGAIVGTSLYWLWRRRWG